MTKNIETYINLDNHEACAQCGALVTTTTDRNAPCQSCIEHAAKRAKHIADNAAAAAKFANELVSVARTEVKNGFQFVGTLANGETIVLRAKATRPYTVAAIHDYAVVTKFRNGDIVDVRGFVTFHQATPKPAYKSDVIIRTLPITEMVVAQ